LFTGNQQFFRLFFEKTFDAPDAALRQAMGAFFSGFEKK